MTFDPGLVLNGIIVLLFFILIVWLFSIMIEKRKELEMLGLTKNITRKRNWLKNNALLSQYDKTLKRFFAERNKEGFDSLVFYATVGVLLITFGYFISIREVFFAVLIPIVLVWFFNMLFKLLLTDIDAKLEEQLPYVIDTMIKVFSKYGDLKSVIYETSQSINDPLKSRMERLARKMLSENQEKSIMDFAEELNNIWVYSMVFIILSYKEDTKKEEIIVNLRHLASIIEKDNALKSADTTDKRYSIALNYMIVVISLVAEGANFIFNPDAHHFFFGTTTGILSFMIGNGAVIAAILLNIKMVSRKGRR